jgi:Tfp pilus assembly protein PilF
VNTQAHDAYLRGRYLLVQRSVGGAVREFQSAISLDPDDALAHAELAITYQLGYLDISDTEAAASAAPHVEKALALDPSIAEAYAAAGVSSWNGGDGQEALRHFEKALQLNPNAAGVHRVTGTRSSGAGRVAEAGAVAGDPA